MKLLRDKIELKNINIINMQIPATNKAIEFYEDYIIEKGSYNYAQSRIIALTSDLTEYMIARENAEENSI